MYFLGVFCKRTSERRRRRGGKKRDTVFQEINGDAAGGGSGFISPRRGFVKEKMGASGGHCTYRRTPRYHFFLLTMLVRSSLLPKQRVCEAHQPSSRVGVGGGGVGKHAQTRKKRCTFYIPQHVPIHHLIRAHCECERKPQKRFHGALRRHYHACPRTIHSLLAARTYHACDDPNTEIERKPQSRFHGLSYGLLLCLPSDHILRI